MGPQTNVWGILFMLDRSKLLKELHSLADKLFVDTSQAHDLAQTIWQQIAKDAAFIYKVRELKKTPWPVPLWDDNLLTPNAKKLMIHQITKLMVHFFAVD